MEQGNRAVEARDQSLDALRVVALVAIITLHSLEGGYYALPEGHAVDEMTRFAVPAFFTLSGFFWRPAAVGYPGAVLGRLVRRVLPAFLLWLTIYWTIDLLRFAGGPAPGLSLDGVVDVLWTGGNAAYHLWYLPALIVGAAVALMVNAWIGTSRAVLVGLALYAAGVAIGAYGKFWGLHLTIGVYRNGLLFAPIFLLAGMWLRQHEAKVRAIVPAVAVMAVLLSARLQLAEGDMLMQAERDLSRPFRRDFGIPTLAFGLSVVVLFMTFRIPGRFWTRLGGMTFAGYLAHLLVLRLVALGFSDAPPQILFVAVTAIATFAAVFAYQLLRDIWQAMARRAAPRAG